MKISLSPRNHHHEHHGVACRLSGCCWAVVRMAGKAVSLALATHWVFNYALGQLFLPALNAVGISGVYLFFALVCGVTVLFTSSQLVETKGRSLDEIQKLMAA